MEDEIYQIVQLFLANDKKATEYYESQKIGIDKMLSVKKENAVNAERLIRELVNFNTQDISEIISDDLLRESLHRIYWKSMMKTVGEDNAREIVNNLCKC
jgi:hypothetical protein